MTNKEAIMNLNRIDIDLLKTVDCGNKTSKRMEAGRERKAVQLAIAAIENQSKYENALTMLVHDLAVLVKKVSSDDTPIETMTRDGVNRYKRKAGIEVPG